MCLLVTVNLSTPPSLYPFSPLILNPFTVLYHGLCSGALVCTPFCTIVFYPAVLYLLNDAMSRSTPYILLWNFHPVYRNVPCCVLSVCWSLLLTQTVWATLWCTVFVPDTYCICRSLLDSWLDHTSLCCAVWLQPVPVMVSGATCKSRPICRWAAGTVSWDVTRCRFTATPSPQPHCSTLNPAANFNRGRCLCIKQRASSEKSAND